MIKTRYIPATDTTGSKIRATCNGKQVSMPYPYQLSGRDVHESAANMWAKKHGRTLTGASRFNDKTGGYIFSINCP